jgi:hypothetical protein
MKITKEVYSCMSMLGGALDDESVNGRRSSVIVYQTTKQLHGIMIVHEVL